MATSHYHTRQPTTPVSGRILINNVAEQLQAYLGATVAMNRKTQTPDGSGGRGKGRRGRRLTAEHCTCLATKEGNTASVLCTPQPQPHPSRDLACNTGRSGSLLLPYSHNPTVSLPRITNCEVVHAVRHLMRQPHISPWTLGAKYYYSLLGPSARTHLAF